MGERANNSRLISLDVLRGITIMGMILVNSMAGMKYGAEANVFPTLLHAHWDGLMLADLVFPGFLMMVGVSIPLALGAHKHDGATIGARTFRLILLGFLLSNLGWFADFSSGDWRLFGVLQRIGLVYGACALLFVYCPPKIRAVLIGVLLVGYWPLTLLPTLDGVPIDIWQRGMNFVGSLDRVLLGAGNHNYVTGPTGYDPEGLLGTLPAVAHGLIGVAIGEFLLKRPTNCARTLALAGAAMVVLGAMWGYIFPIIKDIWSSSFVLVTCGISSIALAGLHHWLDNPNKRSVAAHAFVAVTTAFGANAIAAYVIHEITASVPTWQLILLPFTALRPILGDAWASFIPVLIYMGLIWLAMDYLARRRWIFKI